jgi:hypothetical protein
MGAAGCLYRINRRKDHLKVGEGVPREETNRNHNKICRCTGEIRGWDQGGGIPRGWFGLTNFLVRIYDWDRSGNDWTIRRFLEPCNNNDWQASCYEWNLGPGDARKGWGVRGVTEEYMIKSPIYRSGYDFLTTSRSVIYIPFTTQPSAWQGYACAAIHASAS